MMLRAMGQKISGQSRQWWRDIGKMADSDRYNDILCNDCFAVIKRDCKFVIVALDPGHHPCFQFGNQRLLECQSVSVECFQANWDSNIGIFPAVFLAES